MFVSVKAEQIGRHPAVSCMVDVTGVPHKIVRDVVQTDEQFVYRTLVKDREGNTVYGATETEPRSGRSML